MSTAIELAFCILALPLPSSPAFDVHLDAKLEHDAAFLLLETELSILSIASEILESQAYHSEALQEALAFSQSKALIQTSILTSMTDFIESAELLPYWQPVIKQDLTEGDSLEADNFFSNIKASVARVVVAVVSADRIMDEVFRPESGMQWIIERCKRWIRSGPDLIITSSTMLANLARRGAVTQNSSCRFLADSTFFP